MLVEHVQVFVGSPSIKIKDLAPVRVHTDRREAEAKRDAVSGAIEIRRVKRQPLVRREFAGLPVRTTSPGNGAM